MIGYLPKSLEVDGKSYPIRSDYRVALIIFEAFSDPNLNAYAQQRICLESLYVEIPENIAEAYKKAIWFLDGGDTPKSKPLPVKVLDWDQDQYMIFPELNKAAGYNVRNVEYLHWWEVLGLFNIIGDGLLAQVMNIRTKKAKGKPLEKWEREFYESHKELINIKEKLSAAEQAELDSEKEFIDSLI